MYVHAYIYKCSSLHAFPLDYSFVFSKGMEFIAKFITKKKREKGKKKLSRMRNALFTITHAARVTQAASHLFLCQARRPVVTHAFFRRSRVLSLFMQFFRHSSVLCVRPSCVFSSFSLSSFRYSCFPFVTRPSLTRSFCPSFRYSSVICYSSHSPVTHAPLLSMNTYVFIRYSRVSFRY